jgi:hypothetical protein
MQTVEFFKTQTVKYNFLFKSIYFVYNILDIVRSYLTVFGNLVRIHWLHVLHIVKIVVHNCNY